MKKERQLNLPLLSWPGFSEPEKLVPFRGFSRGGTKIQGELGSGESVTAPKNAPKEKAAWDPCSWNARLLLRWDGQLLDLVVMKTILTFMWHLESAFKIIYIHRPITNQNIALFHSHSHFHILLTKEWCHCGGAEGLARGLGQAFRSLEAGLTTCYRMLELCYWKL